MNGGDAPAGVVTVSVLGPGSAFAAMVTNIERLVAVPPGPTLAVILPPLNVADVAPFRLVPVRAIIKVLPAIPVRGVIAVIAGRTEITVKLTVEELPPPGEGLKTAMLRLPGFVRSVPGITALIVADVSVDESSTVEPT